MIAARTECKEPDRCVRASESHDRTRDPGRSGPGRVDHDPEALPEGSCREDPGPIVRHASWFGATLLVGVGLAIAVAIPDGEMAQKVYFSGVASSFYARSLCSLASRLAGSKGPLPRCSPQRSSPR
jgi:hypothetical protein